MHEESKEKEILSVQARFKLYDLASGKWPESEGDPEYLSEKLAKMLLDSGIYVDPNSRLVDHKGRGGKKAPDQWAIIDMGSEEGLVVSEKDDARGTSNPMLFDSKEEAKRYAMRMEVYNVPFVWDEDCFDDDNIVILWNATHLTFKKNRATEEDSFSLTDADHDSIHSASKIEIGEELAKQIAKIIDIENIGDPEAIIPRGLYQSADEFAHRVESARRSQIIKRWLWIRENGKIKDDSGKIKIKRHGEEPPGKHGKHTNPGIVDLARQVDFELVSILIELLEREVPTIAEVLCRSHLWRTKEEGLIEEDGKSRPSLNSQEDIGCRVGDDLAKVASDMIRFQFSVQPVFDSTGSQLGSLELKRITGLVGREGWGSLPTKVSEEDLSETGLLGPIVPMVDAMERLDTISQVLSRSIDAIIFKWDESRHSKRQGFPEDCRGILDDGLHIVTSHDIIAYSMETGN